MKPTLFLIAGLLLFAPVAGAQVIVNQAALDQLAGIAPPVIAAPPAIQQPPRKITYRHVSPRRVGIRHPLAPRLAFSPSIAKPVPPAQVATSKPVVQPVVAKPVIPPAAPAPQLPQPAVIHFAAGGSDLPGNSAAMLKPFCAHSGGLITIDAYAAADPSDPSSAARLSMQRAFAIRDALAACGIASSLIIPRANGAAKTNPDAAEISASP